MTARSALLGFGIAAATAIAGCGGEDRPRASAAPATTPAASRPPEVTVGCRRRIEAAGPRIVAAGRAARDDLRTAVTWFSALRRAERMDVFGGPRRGDSVFKSAVGIRSGRTVVVTLAAAPSGAVALDYDPRAWRRGTRRVARGAGARSVRFVACRASQPSFTDGRPLGRWTWFAGGFLVAAPACARLTIRAQGGPAVRQRVAFGRPCP